MAAIEICDAVFAAAVGAVYVAGIEADTGRIALAGTDLREHRIRYKRVARVGRIVERFPQRTENFLLEGGGRDIGLHLVRRLAATAGKRHGQSRHQPQTGCVFSHRTSQSSLSFFRRCASVRSRSALSLMKPSASR